MSQVRRIVFVDDEPLVLEGLRDLLRPMRKRWRMSFLGGGEAALEELARESCDVIVSDMRMPGMSGVQLLQRVRELYPRTVRIVLSGHSELDAALQCATIAHQFLAKPCSSALLQAVIERACELRALLGDDERGAALGKLGHLPSPPGMLLKLANALAGERPADEIGRLVESDPAMSAKVLQLVSSAFFGHAGRVRSVPHAVELLGASALRQLVAAVEEASAGAPPDPQAARALEQMQRHSLFAARIAARLCSNERMAADAFMAALLHCVGRLALSGDPGRQTEGGNARSGAYLLGLWGLPAPLVDAVAAHESPRRIARDRLALADAVHFASELSRRFADSAAADQLLERIAALPAASEPMAWEDLARQLGLPAEAA